MRPGPAFSAAMVHPRLPLAAALVAVLLMLPSLWLDRGLDDHVHRLLLAENPGVEGLPVVLMELFVSTGGDPAQTRTLMENGVLPWWTLEEMHVAFWRPLSAFTHWLDYMLWPDTPWLMHLHSLAWFGALAYAVARLYRRSLGATLAAGVAALFFAADDAHGFAAGWLATRNAIVACLFGVLCLVAYDRWRREGWRPGALLAPLCLGLALLSNEGGIAAAGYLVAYPLFLDRAGWRSRIAALLPCLAVIAVWRVVYVALGYRAYGASLYLDPTEAPLRFAAALVERGPLLLLAQWAGPPADLYLGASESAIHAWWLGAVAFLALLAALLWRRLRDHRTARFWACGMLLAVVPATAALPNDRLLFLTGVGAMALAADLMLSLWRHRKAGGRAWRFAAPAMAGVLLLAHGVAAPVVAPFRSLTAAAFEPIERGVEDLPDDPALAHQHLVVAHAPTFFHTAYIPILRALDGGALPKYTRLLASGSGPIRYTRTGERTLVVEPEGGFLRGIAQWVRDARYPLALGETVRLAGLRITVTALTGDGRPAAVEARFDWPLEDPRLRWVASAPQGFEPFTPPAIGESLLLRPAGPPRQ